MGRQRQTAGGARAIDDVRARRASQAAAVGQVAGPGNTVDASGRIVPDLGDGQYIDRAGKQQIRTSGVLVLTPGSPKAFTIALSADFGQNARGDLVIDEATPTSALVRLRDLLKRYADAAVAELSVVLTPRVVVLEARQFGTATLAAGTVTISLASWNAADSFIVVQRQTSGTSAGLLKVDPASYSAHDFLIVSDDALDDGVVSWLSIRMV